MTTPERDEPGRDAGIREIQADIDRTRGELGDTVNALSANLDAKRKVVAKTRAVAKPPLAVVASIAGITVVGVFWWRRRSGRRG